jgi:hypothetical protein
LDYILHIRKVLFERRVLVSWRRNWRNKDTKEAGYQWLTPVILATQEAEIRIVV